MHILYTSVHPAAHDVAPTAKGGRGVQTESDGFDRPLLLSLCEQRERRRVGPVFRNVRKDDKKN